LQAKRAYPQNKEIIEVYKRAFAKNKHKTYKEKGSSPVME